MTPFSIGPKPYWELVDSSHVTLRDEEEQSTSLNSVWEALVAT